MTLSRLLILASNIDAKKQMNRNNKVLESLLVHSRTGIFRNSFTRA